MTTTEPRRPHPAARRVIRDALKPFGLGLSMTELRRQTSRGGSILVVGEDRRNVAEDFDEVLAYLVSEGLVAQRLIGTGVRYVDAVTYPATTTESETER
jgi:hypothetical protein